MAEHPLFLTVTPESRTHVYKIEGGEIEVYANVLLQAKSARVDGGAVSLPFENGYTFQFRPCEIYLARVGSIR